MASGNLIGSGFDRSASHGNTTMLNRKAQIRDAHKLAAAHRRVEATDPRVSDARKTELLRLVGFHTIQALAWDRSLRHFG